MHHWRKSLKILNTLQRKEPNRVKAYVSTKVSRESLLFLHPESAEGEIFLTRTLPGTKSEWRPRTSVRKDQHRARFRQLLKQWPKNQFLAALPQGSPKT